MMRVRLHFKCDALYGVGVYDMKRENIMVRDGNRRDLYFDEERRWRGRGRGAQCRMSFFGTHPNNDWMWAVRMEDDMLSCRDNIRSWMEIGEDEDHCLLAAFSSSVLMVGMKDGSMGSMLAVGLYAVLSHQFDASGVVQSWNGCCRIKATCARGTWRMKIGIRVTSGDDGIDLSAHFSLVCGC